MLQPVDKRSEEVDVFGFNRVELMVILGLELGWSSSWGRRVLFHGCCVLSLLLLHVLHRCGNGSLQVRIILVVLLLWLLGAV